MYDEIENPTLTCKATARYVHVPSILIRTTCNVHVRMLWMMAFAKKAGIIHAVFRLRVSVRAMTISMIGATATTGTLSRLYCVALRSVDDF